jgi:hypothetical protein
VFRDYNGNRFRAYVDIGYDGLSRNENLHQRLEFTHTYTAGLSDRDILDLLILDFFLESVVNGLGAGCDAARSETYDYTGFGRGRVRSQLFARFFPYLINFFDGFHDYSPE